MQDGKLHELWESFNLVVCQKRLVQQQLACTSSQADKLLCRLDKLSKSINATVLRLNSYRQYINAFETITSFFAESLHIMEYMLKSLRTQHLRNHEANLLAYHCILDAEAHMSKLMNRFRRNENYINDGIESNTYRHSSKSRLLTSIVNSTSQEISTGITTTSHCLLEKISSSDDMIENEHISSALIMIKDHQSVYHRRFHILREHLSTLRNNCLSSKQTLLALGVPQGCNKHNVDKDIEHISEEKTMAASIDRLCTEISSIQQALCEMQRQRDKEIERYEQTVAELCELMGETHRCRNRILTDFQMVQST